MQRVHEFQDAFVFPDRMARDANDCGAQCGALALPERRFAYCSRAMEAGLFCHIATKPTTPDYAVATEKSSKNMLRVGAGLLISAPRLPGFWAVASGEF